MPPNLERWRSITSAERARFLGWVDGEIKRLRSGGAVPWCFDGSPEEMIASLEAERDAYMKDGSV